MKVTVVLTANIIDDLPRRQALIDTLRHTRGVLGLDTEMVDNGLLLVELSKEIDIQTFEKLEGVERIMGISVKGV